MGVLFLVICLYVNNLIGTESHFPYENFHVMKCIVVVKTLTLTMIQERHMSISMIYGNITKDSPDLPVKTCQHIFENIVELFCRIGSFL